jgi:hypothetical protein
LVFVSLSLFFLFCVWFIAIGIEIYFRVRHPKTSDAPSSPVPSESLEEQS